MTRILLRIRFRQSGTGRSAHPTDAIDRAEDIRLVELRSRATEFVPAARVEDDEAAVCVFQHVGRMEVEIVRDHEV